MRDPMTGEDITDQPDRWPTIPEPTLLGRWTTTEDTNEH